MTAFTRRVLMHKVAAFAVLLWFGHGSAGAEQQLPPESDKLLSTNVGIGTEITVLVVVDEKCQPCWDSIPFYKKLLALPRMDSTRRRLVVLVRSGVIPVKEILDAQGFRPHHLTSGPREVRDVVTVPSVIVIGPDGKRRGAWEGRLTAQQETEVLKAIGPA